MQPLPSNFLNEIAQRYGLSPEQTEVFLERFSTAKGEIEIAEALHITPSALRSRMSGVYRKFSISSKGPVKAHELMRFLFQEYQAKVIDFKPVNVRIDDLVNQIREQIRGDIQERCGTMRVLDMSQPIGLNDIYISVNILEKVTGRRNWELNELLRNIPSKDFDRFHLGNVKERHVPGLKAVERFSKLLILGKPGAGKTTFLKHLAIQCISSQESRVPIFVTLKDFAEAPEQPDLLTYVECKIHTSTETVLQAGRALLLLDGLDEVRKSDSRRVLSQIQGLADRYYTSRFVITCRIAAQEYIFQQFTEVEIADFNDQQIANFAIKWFNNKQDSIKADRFLQKLKSEPSIRELATSPILLTLLCLVFEDSGSFPSNRSELYKSGTDVLLKRWDTTRNIERDQSYRKLSVQRKEDLLSQIAYSTFETGSYFIKQRELEHQITSYIKNLPDASTDSETLELDSAAVLKSIEAQYGLLVERARGIYSFSHLTFHEYFTARQIAINCNPRSIDDEVLRELVKHLTERRWREVFLLAVGMLPTSDSLLRLMKTHTDQILAQDKNLQQFLQWVNQKSIDLYRKSQEHSVEISLTALRACYFDFDIALDPDRTLGCVINFPCARTFACASLLSRATDLEFSEVFHNIPSELNQFRALEPALALALDRTLAINIYLQHINHDSVLGQNLQQLRSELPHGNSETALTQWWEVKGKDWGDRLREVMVSHCSLGEHWRFDDFSEHQKELLKQYYYANLLLAVCLNSECYVSREVRQEIEETLLLPLAGSV